MQTEIYERKNVSLSTHLGGSLYLVETKSAYVKRNSGVKPETLWKYGLLDTSYVVDKAIK
jgi:hypothetical protein